MTWTDLTRRSRREDGAQVKRTAPGRWRCFSPTGVWIDSATTRRAAKALLDG